MSAKEWEAFRKKHRQLQNKLRFIQELEESAKEVKLMMQGRKKGVEIPQIKKRKKSAAKAPRHEVSQRFLKWRSLDRNVRRKTSDALQKVFFVIP